MKSDFHMHTGFSKDSTSSPEEMIQESIRRGLKTICITDHHDVDYSEPDFEIDFESYFRALERLQKQYSSQID